MADTRKFVKQTNEVCSHCEGYAVTFAREDNPDRLCGDCILLPKEQRDAEKRYVARVAEGRKKADEAAKKAYSDELRRLNEEAVVEVVGEGTKESRKASAE